MRAFLYAPAAALAACLSLTAAAQAPLVAIDASTAPPTLASAPFAVGVDFDVLCSGWVGATDEKFPGRIVGAQMVSSQTIFMEGDILYLDLGTRDGVAAGQEFWVVRPGETVWADDSELKTVGRFYDTPSRLKVLCVQERTAVAELVMSCTDTEIGDRILPFEPIPIPLVRATPRATVCDPPNGKTIGRIIRVKDRAVPVGQESIIYLDLGERDGLQPGQFMTVYRSHASVPDVRTVLGEVAVLSLRERTAVAKVTYSRDVMYAGDSVEVK